MVNRLLNRAMEERIGALKGVLLPQTDAGAGFATQSSGQGSRRLQKLIAFLVCAEGKPRASLPACESHRLSRAVHGCASTSRASRYTSPGALSAI